MSKELVELSPHLSAAGTSVLQKLNADSEGQASMMLTVTQLPTPPTLAPP